MGVLNIVLGTPLIDDLRYLQITAVLTEVASLGGYAQAAARANLGFPPPKLRFSAVGRPQLQAPDGTWRELWISDDGGIVVGDASDIGDILPNAFARLKFNADGWPQIADATGMQWRPVAVVGAEGALQFEVGDAEDAGSVDLGSKVRFDVFAGEMQIAHKTAGTWHALTLAALGDGISVAIGAGI
jgi:hypothetical protein